MTISTQLRAAAAASVLAMGGLALASAAPALAHNHKEKPAKAQANIVQTAIGTGVHETLVAAVQAADLADTLSAPGPFTVFAPTDDAFAALPAGTVDSLLLPENKGKLQDILKYHVVAGRVPAAALSARRRVALAWATTGQFSTTSGIIGLVTRSSRLSPSANPIAANRGRAGAFIRWMRQSRSSASPG